jgi:hypothetical protein
VGIAVGSSPAGGLDWKGVGVGSSDTGLLSGGTTTSTVAVGSGVGVIDGVNDGVGVEDGRIGSTELGSIPGGTMMTPG